MNAEPVFKYHFYQLSSKRAVTHDANRLKKLSFISEELNTELYVFLWIDENNEIEKFHFFFFEKVIEWSKHSGLSTNITNRLQSAVDGKIGVHKGARTLQRIDDPTMLEEALEILNQSIFPLGIKDILKLRISKIT
ncbi:MAG: hypothetical protein ABIK92_15835 [Pseudomonadota bacterium]